MSNANATAMNLIIVFSNLSRHGRRRPAATLGWTLQRVWRAKSRTAEGVTLVWHTNDGLSPVLFPTVLCAQRR